MNTNKINLKNLHFQELVETGNNYIREQNLKLAEKYYDEAFKKINSVSSNDSFYLNYANCKLQLLKYHQAKKFYERALSLNSNIYFPYKGIALCEIALSTKAQNDNPLYIINSKSLINALNNLNYAVRINPDDIENYKLLASIYTDLFEIKSAIENYKKYLFVKFDIEIVKRLFHLLNLYSLGDEIFELSNYWLKSNFLKSGDIEFFHRNLSICFFSSGDFTKAVPILEKCLNYRKYFAGTIVNLNSIRKFNTNDEIVKNVEIGLKRNFFTEKEIPMLYQFLADVFENKDDKAFLNYLSLSKNARLAASKSKFEINESILIENSKLFENVIPLQVKNFNPIFIVGMPRSGTTLAHQVITNHSAVQGLGEFPLLGQVLKFLSKKISKTFSHSDLQNFIENVSKLYIDNARLINNKKLFFVDKSPFNFRFIGLILKLFPNAKIISCERDPIDNCWSIYRNYFNEDYRFFYKLEDIGATYNSYKKIMVFWKKTFSPNIFILNYEHFIDNQSKVIKDLLKFCNLNFENNCLSPEKNQNNVNTLSITQVRKKINTSSLGQWKKYANEIEPLIKSLSI